VDISHEPFPRTDSEYHDAVPFPVVSIASVAFGSYVFEPVHSRDGVHLERGEDVNGNVLAVGAAGLQTHVGGQIAFQSRRAPSLLDVVAQAGPVGH
jgi:hypothetical protein